MSNKNTDELWKRYEITREVFERPLEMTKHEDEKAGRILASVAFLTVAAAAVFSTFLNKGVKFELSLFCSQRLDLIPISFAGYVVFVVIGTIFMLEAFGPSFELPKVWATQVKSQEKGRGRVYEPQSTFFFEKISEEDRNQWVNYFAGAINEILTKACNDHVFEAHLVSRKVKKKVRSINWGKRFFYVAMAMFAVLIVVGCYAYAIA
jgi:hypothetical protein